MNMDGFEIVVLLAVVFIHGIIIGYIIGAPPPATTKDSRMD